MKQKYFLACKLIYKIYYYPETFLQRPAQVQVSSGSISIQFKIILFIPKNSQEF